MNRQLRWWLLASYLTVMALILSIFGAGVYGFFSRSLYRQLDDNLLTLAQAAAPTLIQAKYQGRQYLDRLDAVPWQDIFDRDLQSLEWFNQQGQLIATKGSISVASAPQLGGRTLWRSPSGWFGEPSPFNIRMYTIPVYQVDNPDRHTLEGYIRASQSTHTLETAQYQLLWGLAMGGAIALLFAGAGGIWLTQKALEPIEQSFNQLKQFTADASHELRSPLTAIKTSVDVMLNHPERVHPKDAKKLAAIASATDQINRLAEDLLFLARTDNHTSILKQEQARIDLNFLLQEIIELLEDRARSKEILLQLQMLAQVSVMGDRAELMRLFTNLLENALQYTLAGGKVICTLAIRKRMAIISIEDTGIGIAPDQLPFIFDRFWRADKARSQRREGTGLGLSIAQAIAQQHGGKIAVTSQVGVGTCFRVRLPVASI